MTIDVSAFTGGYPFRHVERTSPDDLLRAMDRVEIARAWVGHLGSFLYRDPAPANAALVRALEPHADRLLPIPAVHPGLPDMARDLDRARDVGAPAVRVYPNWQGLDPAGDAMRALAAEAAARALPLVLTVRFEDSRQRHPLDVARDLPAAGVRLLVRADPGVRLLVTHADRAFIEEVHFGLTPAEARRVLWDFSWIWGPPEDHFRLLLRTVGVERFTLGTGMPLRLPEAAFAKLELLALDAPVAAALVAGNLHSWLHG